MNQNQRYEVRMDFTGYECRMAFPGASALQNLAYQKREQGHRKVYFTMSIFRVAVKSPAVSV